jgi:hypothetical protein
MNRRTILGVSVATTTGFAFLVGVSVAQEKTFKGRLVGTWLVATVDNIRPDGSRFQSLGPNPKGILMFDAQECRFFLMMPGEILACLLCLGDRR